MSEQERTRFAPRRVTGAFTLLEVMVALGILSSGLGVLYYSQTLSVRSVGRAKMLTAATLLARAKMVELEDALYEEGFGSFSEETASGDFEDLGFEKFRWQTKVEKVVLPGSLDLKSGVFGLAGGAPGEEGRPGQEGGAGQMDVAMQAIVDQFDAIRGTLEEAVRRATVTVSWDEGRHERSVSVEAYFTDPTLMDVAAMMSGGGTAPPAGGPGPKGGTPPPGGAR